MTSTIHFQQPFQGKTQFTFRDDKHARRWARDNGLSVRNAIRKGDDYFFGETQLIPAYMQKELPEVIAPKATKTLTAAQQYKRERRLARKNRKPKGPSFPYLSAPINVTGMTDLQVVRRAVFPGDIIDLYGHLYRIWSVQHDVDASRLGRELATEIQVEDKPGSFFLFDYEYYRIFPGARPVQ